MYSYHDALPNHQLGRSRSPQVLANSIFLLLLRSKKQDLIEILETIAADSLKANGFFHSGPELECSKLHRPPKSVSKAESCISLVLSLSYIVL